MPTRSHRPLVQLPFVGVRATLVVAIGFLVSPRAHEARAQRAAHGVDSARVTSPRAAACVAPWTPPRELRTPLGQRVYVEAPATAVDRRGRYLFGRPTFIWADRDTFVAAEQREYSKAAGVKLVGEWSALPLPALPGSMPQYAPLPVSAGEHLLALWATSRDTTWAGFSRQDTLWESRLSSDRWTPPRAIWSSGTLTWHPGAVALTTVGSTVVAAFPARDTTRAPQDGVVVMQRVRDAWRTTFIGTGNLGVSAVALLPLSASEFLVAATGGLERPPIEALNAVYTIRVSTAAGVDAPRFSLIRDFKQQSHAVEPSVFRSSEGVHVVWRQPMQGPFAHDSVSEATSADEGTTWTTSTASLETNAIGLSIRALGDGDAFGAALDVRAGKIITLRRASSRWTLTEESLPDAKTTPMLSNTRDRIAVMFAQTRSSPGPQGPFDAPVLVMSTRALRCESSPATRSRKRLRAPPRGKSTLK